MPAGRILPKKAEANQWWFFEGRTSEPDRSALVTEHQSRGRGTLHFESGHGYFISVKSDVEAEKESRVWLWISEDKETVRILAGLDGKEVIAKGKLAQLPEGIHANVPPLGMYMKRFEIERAGAPNNREGRGRLKQLGFEDLRTHF